MNKKAYVSLCMAIFVAMLGLGIISPLMALYANSLGATGFWLGLMYSGFSLTRIVVLPIAGWFSDMKGRKSLMIIGLGSYTVISVLYASAANIQQLTAIRLMHGVASAMVVPIAQAYVGDLIPEGKEGTYMNIYSMIMMLGMAAGPVMGGFLSDIFEVNTVFYVMGAFAAVAFMMVILTVPNLEPQSKRVQVKRPSFMTMLKDNRLRAVSLFMASRGIFRQSINAFLPLFAVATLGLSRSVAGTLVSIFMLTEAVSGGILGPISDKFDKRKLMILGAATAPLILLFLPGAVNVTTLLLVLIPLGFLGGLGRAPAMAFNVQSGRRHGRMGSSMGLVNMAMSTGNFIGPFVSGYIIDHWGVGNIYYFGAIVGILSISPIVYWLYKKEPVLIVNPAAEKEPTQSHD